MHSLVVIPLVISKERVSHHASKFSWKQVKILFVLSLGLVLECTHPHWCCLDMKSFYVSCSTTLEFSSVKALRWYIFKQLKGNQGVEKLFLTPGCITKHKLLPAHLQANIWLQDLVADQFYWIQLLWDGDNWRTVTMSQYHQRLWWNLWSVPVLPVSAVDIALVRHKILYRPLQVWRSWGHMTQCCNWSKFKRWWGLGWLNIYINTYYYLYCHLIFSIMGKVWQFLIYSSHLEFMRLLTNKKIGNSFFCVLCKLRKWKITSFQILYKKLTKLHNGIHCRWWWSKE